MNHKKKTKQKKVDLSVHLRNFWQTSSILNQQSHQEFLYCHTSVVLRHQSVTMRLGGRRNIGGRRRVNEKGIHEEGEERRVSEKGMKEEEE